MYLNEVGVNVMKIDNLKYLLLFKPLRSAVALCDITLTRIKKNNISYRTTCYLRQLMNYWTLIDSPSVLLMEELQQSATANLGCNIKEEADAEGRA